MSGVVIGIIILAAIGIPVLIWGGLHTFRQNRRPPSRHLGRPDHVHCPACGEKNAANAAFCEKCGHRLGGAPGG